MPDQTSREATEPARSWLGAMGDKFRSMLHVSSFPERTDAPIANEHEPEVDVALDVWDETIDTSYAIRLTNGRIYYNNSDEIRDALDNPNREVDWSTRRSALSRRVLSMLLYGLANDWTTAEVVVRCNDEEMFPFEKIRLFAHPKEGEAYELVPPPSRSVKTIENEIGRLFGIVEERFYDYADLGITHFSQSEQTKPIRVWVPVADFRDGEKYSLTYDCRTKNELTGETQLSNAHIALCRRRDGDWVIYSLSRSDILP